MLKFILILFLGYINFYTTHATTIATVTLIETLGHGFQDNSEDFKPLTERSTIYLPLEWQTETRSMKTSVNYSVRLKGVSIFPHISLIRIRDLCINCSHLCVVFRRFLDSNWTFFVCGFFKFFRSCHYKEQRKIFQFKLKYFINRMINYLQKNTVAIFFI